MPRKTKPGTVQFALDVSIEAKLRFATLHESLGFKTKSETFEAILYYVSTVEKIDPAVMDRVERKLDRITERFDDLI